MKNILIVIVLTATVLTLKIDAQNNNPTVNNVIVMQREDGSFITDIFYDVTDSDGDPLEITLLVSDDAGSSWNFSCNNISGDIGGGISSGAGKHIIWDFGSEHPETFGEQFRIKIIADDGKEEPGVPCPGLPTITYEGKVYNTVLIGSNCWLRENLDIGTMIESTMAEHNQTDNGVIEKYCYDNIDTNCTIYGGLYQWGEAMQYEKGGKGLCPENWHIPTTSDFESLGGSGNALKAIGQGELAGAGTNSTGFSALLAGGRFYSDGSHYGLGVNALFWLSDEKDERLSWGIKTYATKDAIGYFTYDKNRGYSIRCVRN